MKQQRNYLLMVASLFTRAQEITYSISRDGKNYLYTGMQTNEAVAKYLIESLAERGCRLDKIVMLCSPEVMELRIEAAGNKTTYEYFSEEIGGYYRNIHGDGAPEDLFVPIPYVNAGNERPELMLKSLRSVLETTEQGERNQNLYIDFTGGVRSAAVTLVFMARILQSRKVNIKRVLYSNISNGAGVIEEMTKVYGLFDYLAVEIESRYGDITALREYALKNINPEAEEEAYKLLNSLDRQSQAEKANQAGEIVKISQRNKKNAKQLEERVGESLGGDLLIKIGKEKGKIADEAEKTGSSTLALLKQKLDAKTTNFADALNYFRQEFVSRILPEMGIVELSSFSSDKEEGKTKNDWEKMLSDEMLAAFIYYEEWNYKTGELTGGFFKAMKCFLAELQNQIPNSPRKVSSAFFGEAFFDPVRILGRLKDKYRENGWGQPSDILSDKKSRSICREKIIFYLQEKYQAGGDLREYIEFYDELQIAYAKNGYPLECAYNGRLCDGYKNLYENIRKRGTRLLQIVYEGKNTPETEMMFRRIGREPCSYEELIRFLNESENDCMVRALFPFSIRSNVLKPGKIMRESGQDWNSFLYELAKCFRAINPIRNKLIHSPQSLDLNDTRVGDAIKEVQKMIGVLESFRPDRRSMAYEEGAER